MAHHRKGLARETVFHALEAAARPGPELAVRINPPSGDQTLSGDDLDMILPSRQLEVSVRPHCPCVRPLGDSTYAWLLLCPAQAIVVPKVEHEDDIRFILAKAKALRNTEE